MNLNSDKINSQIRKLKKNFEKDREKIKKTFLKENNGRKNCRNNSNLIDTLILEIYKILKLYQNNIERNISVCAVGGYGRKILAPFSDLDILFIYTERFEKKEIEYIVQFLLFPLWDLGFKIGYAVRNLTESVDFPKHDHIIQTSMLDARRICGSKKLFNYVMKRFEKDVSKSGFNLLKKKILERKNRLIELSYDYFRNEPNLKENEGSLRDLNLIFWGLRILQLKNKSQELNNFLTNKEKKELRESLEFLLLLRCHLHYQSQRANDKLSFDYQHSISKKIQKYFKSTDLENNNANVEKMMRDYFLQIRNTKNLAEVIVQVLEEKLQEKKNRSLSPSIPRKKPKDILGKFLKKLSTGEDQPNEKRLILENIKNLEEEEIFTKENVRRIKKIFFSRKKERFICLSDLGILSRILPEFAKIEYLPQFDRYHSLTVGQHTIKAVNILKDFEAKRMDRKNYGFFYQVLKKKYNRKALYFATLLHDIGKGRGGEHNIKGAKIARKVVSRFNESSEIAKETGWLVLNHSMLSDVAFKKDLEDHSVIRKVSKSIKTIPRLTSLFLLTVTDISAVEQGLWNYWKASLLRELYLKLENQIKNPKEIISLGDRIEKIKLNIVKKSKKISALSLRGFSKIAYPNYWLLQSEKMIILQIENFFLKKKKNFSFIIKKADEKYFFDLILVTKDRSKLFLNLISIFVYDKVSIYEARIFTLDDGTVIDTFKFSIDFNQKFNAIDEERILSSIKEKLDKLGKEQVILIKENPVKKIKIIHTMMDVTIDNQSSSTYTILNVKTNDRPKLLYDISKILIRNKVVISMAKISTNGDFVEDSFHLRSQHGLKIENTSQINNIINEINKQLSENIEDVT